MYREYDSLLLFPIIILGLGLLLFVPYGASGCPSLPHRGAVVVVGCAFGLLGSILGWLPWWLLEKGVLQTSPTSMRWMLPLYMVYNFIVQLGAGILLVQFLPGIFTFFTQVQQGSLHPDAITFLGVGAFILICIGAFVNMYYYIKARRRRKTS